MTTYLFTVGDPEHADARVRPFCSRACLLTWASFFADDTEVSFMPTPEGYEFAETCDGCGELIPATADEVRA